MIMGTKGFTFYYSGCVKGPDFSKNYKEIFDKLGIRYITLDKEKFTCGSTIHELGYKKEFRSLVIKNEEILKNYRINKIITSCSQCYYILKKIYPEFLRNFNIEIEHASVIILRALKKKKINFRESEEKRTLVGYQDPCYLGRYCNIYEEPRQIIEILGGKILEFDDNRNRAICCGAGGGVYLNQPFLSKDIARKRVNRLDKKASKLITPCNLCYISLSSATENSEELSTFIINKLNELKV